MRANLNSINSGSSRENYAFRYKEEGEKNDDRNYLINAMDSASKRKKKERKKKREKNFCNACNLHETWEKLAYWNI